MLKWNFFKKKDGDNIIDASVELEIVKPDIRDIYKQAQSRATKEIVGKLVEDSLFELSFGGAALHDRQLAIQYLVEVGNDGPETISYIREHFPLSRACKSCYGGIYFNQNTADDICKAITEKILEEDSSVNRG